MLNFLTKHWKPIGIVVGVIVLIGIGYGIASWRHGNQLAEYDAREAAWAEERALKDAEQNKLRGVNESLRQANVQLETFNKAQEAIITERGGSILAEQKKLEQIDVQLAKDEQVIKAPADKCVRCRRFSDVALAQKLIDRPLSCKDECE